MKAFNVISRLAICLIFFLEGITAQIIDNRQVGPINIQVIQMLQDADLLMRVGRHNEAIIVYSEAVNADNSNTKALLKRAQAYKVLGQFDLAMKDYNKAIEIDPYSEYIFDARAALRLLSMDFVGGLADRMQAISIAPENDRFRSQLVDDFIDLGEYDKAFVVLDTLIAHGFELEHEYEKRALLFFKIGEFNEALKNANIALEYNPNSSIAYDVRGLVLMRQGLYQEAIDSFSMAIAFNPEFALAYYNRAIALKFLGENEKSIKDLDQAIEIGMDIPNVFFARAVVRKEMGDLEGGIEDYYAAEMSDSTYTKAIFNRAYTYKLMGDQSNAMADALKILDMDESSVEAWNLRGNIHVIYGEYQEAIEAYDEAIRLRPQYARAHHNRGLAYIMSTRLIQGCNDLSRAIEMGHSSTEELLKYFCGY